MPRSRHIAVLAALAGLGLAACGGGGTSASTATTTANVSSAGGNAGASPIIPIPTSDRSPAGRSGHQPTVVVPTGKPPSHLEMADLIGGSGAVAKSGDQVTVQYVLATYSSGKVVQSSWSAQPFQFIIGAHQVIPGWDEGVAGMRVGGRRELIIPPSLGYGNLSPGPGISSNDTLVFVVDLLKIG